MKYNPRRNYRKKERDIFGGGGELSKAEESKVFTK